MKIKITASTRPDRDRIEFTTIKVNKFYIELDNDKILDVEPSDYKFARNRKSKDGNYYDENGDLVVTYQDLGKEVLDQIFEELHNVPSAYKIKFQIDLDYDKEDNSPSRWVHINVWDMYTSQVNAKSGNIYPDLVLSFESLSNMEIKYDENGNVKILGDKSDPLELLRYGYGYRENKGFKKLVNEGYKMCVKRIEDYLKDHNADPGEYYFDMVYQVLAYYDEESDKGSVDRSNYFSVCAVIYHDPSGEDIEYVQLWQGPWAYKEGKHAD